MTYCVAPGFGTSSELPFRLGAHVRRELQNALMAERIRLIGRFSRRRIVLGAPIGSSGIKRKISGPGPARPRKRDWRERIAGNRRQSGHSALTCPAAALSMLGVKEIYPAEARASGRNPSPGPSYAEENPIPSHRGETPKSSTMSEHQKIYGRTFWQRRPLEATSRSKAASNFKRNC